MELIYSIGVNESYLHLHCTSDIHFSISRFWRKIVVCWWYAIASNCALSCLLLINNAYSNYTMLWHSFLSFQFSLLFSSTSISSKVTSFIWFHLLLFKLGHISFLCNFSKLEFIILFFFLQSLFCISIPYGNLVK